MKYFNDLAILYLRVLYDFLKLQLSEYNDINEDITSVLGDMDMYLFTHKKPADPGTWQDWEIITDELLENLNKESTINYSYKDSNIITKEQAFVAGFKLLVYYWQNKQDFTIKEAIDMIEESIKAFEQNKSNNFWNLWIKYLQEQKDKKYDFSYPRGYNEIDTQQN